MDLVAVLISQNLGFNQDIALSGMGQLAVSQSTGSGFRPFQKRAKRTQKGLTVRLPAHFIEPHIEHKPNVQNMTALV